MSYKILVVDDERWIRKGIIKMIDCERHHITEIFEARSIAQAKQIYETALPDIVLSDICFPTENGCDLGHFIFQKNPDTKIILISAYSDFDYAMQALRFRAFEYLLKPVTEQKLNEVLASCVRELQKQQNTLSTCDTAESPKANQDIASAKEIVHQIAAYIKREYAQKITLPELATKYHLSEAYLSHIFAQEVGMPLTTYLTKIRIDEACRKIRETTDMLHTIAKEVGYDDYQYFVRVFRKTMQISPGTYRNLHKPKTE